MNTTVEIRLPTYHRKRLLQRALASLQSQTYPDWRCVVLDDAMDDPDAREVCLALADDRIEYRKNRTNLGVEGNIDQAFSLKHHPNAAFACVLEDDNYYLPDFLEHNVQIVRQYDVDVVLCNMLIERPSPDAGTHKGQSTVYDNQYVTGIATPTELWGTLFYNNGLLNSGVFWRLGRDLDFSTLEMARDPIFQERLRMLCIDRPAFIDMEPKAVWRDNGEESKRVRASGWRWRVAQVKAVARERELYQRLYEWLKAHDATDCIWRSRFREFDVHAERVFCRVGISVPPDLAPRLPTKVRRKIALKRYAARIAAYLISDPITYEFGESRIFALPRRVERDLSLMSGIKHNSRGISSPHAHQREIERSCGVSGPPNGGLA